MVIVYLNQIVKNFEWYLAKFYFIANVLKFVLFGLEVKVYVWD